MEIRRCAWKIGTRGVDAHRLALGLAQGLDLSNEGVDDGMAAQLSGMTDLANLALFLKGDMGHMKTFLCRL